MCAGYRKQVGVPFTHRVIHFPPLEREFPLQVRKKEQTNISLETFSHEFFFPNLHANKCGKKHMKRLPRGLWPNGIQDRVALRSSIPSPSLLI